jgi:hypothetical protein
VRECATVRSPWCDRPTSEMRGPSPQDRSGDVTTELLWCRYVVILVCLPYFVVYGLI